MRFFGQRASKTETPVAVITPREYTFVLSDPHNEAFLGVTPSPFSKQFPQHAASEPIPAVLYALNSLGETNNNLLDIQRNLTGLATSYVQTKKHEQQLNRLLHLPKAERDTYGHELHYLNTVENVRKLLRDEFYGKVKEKSQTALNGIKVLVTNGTLGITTLLERAATSFPSLDQINESTPVGHEVNELYTDFIDSSWQVLATRTLAFTFGALGGWRGEIGGTNIPTISQIEQGARKFFALIMNGQDKLTIGSLQRALDILTVIAQGDMPLSQEPDIQRQLIKRIFGKDVASINSLISDKAPEDPFKQPEIQKTWQALQDMLNGKSENPSDRSESGIRVGSNQGLHVTESIRAEDLVLTLTRDDQIITVSPTSIRTTNPNAIYYVSLIKPDGKVYKMILSGGILQTRDDGLVDETPILHMPFGAGDRLIMSNTLIDNDDSFGRDHQLTPYANASYTAARLATATTLETGSTPEIITIDWPAYDQMAIDMGALSRRTTLTSL